MKTDEKNWKDTRAGKHHALQALNSTPLFELPGIDSRISQYGDYDPETNEYVIRRPDTPQPWYNYLTNGKLTGFISQTAGGTCFFKDAQNCRILRTHLHSRPVDQPGRWFFIRDHASGEHWSASWAPTFNPLTHYDFECRVGAGYSRIKSRFRQIKTETTYFVAPDAACEIWSFVITNASKQARDLSIFPYAEFILWSQTRDMNLDAAFKCTDILFERDTIVHRSPYDFTGDNFGWANQFAAFGCGLRPESFDVGVDAFIGTYHGYANPLGVMNGTCSNFVNRGGHPCAAMQFRVRLTPGQSKRFNFVLSYGKNEADAKRIVRRCSRTKWVDAQFSKLKNSWRDYLDQFQAQTGDPVFDTPFNYFSPIQSSMTFLLSRSISPYQLMGSRGLGFRDSIQDTLGAMPRESEKARELLADLLATMRPAGDACHAFFPAEKRGDGEGYWDDHLWPAASVSSYVRESGDLKFLDRVLPYWESKETGTVAEHLERGFEFAENHSGRHGLPLLGFADWNDCLNAFPGSESVFTACLYCYAAREAQALFEAAGDKKRANRMAARYVQMAERINRNCWDGGWYVRLLLKNGKKIGSRTNRHGRIFIESNTWAVMSGVATGERAIKTMDNLRKYLGTSYGFRLCHPNYPNYDKAVGSISVFAPGLKENGSIFCHTNPWVICAEALLGRGHMAYDAFCRLSPYTKNKIQSIHCGEPYVVNQMITMPPNKEVGRARNAWLTGTASWFYVSMAEAILGLKADYDGLRIDPCVPGWKFFRIERMFRGVKYSISVQNPMEVEKGVLELSVDGKAAMGNLIPIPPRGTKHVNVIVKMGLRTQL